MDDVSISDDIMADGPNAQPYPQSPPRQPLVDEANLTHEQETHHQRPQETAHEFNARHPHATGESPAPKAEAKKTFSIWNLLPTRSRSEDRCSLDQDAVEALVAENDSLKQQIGTLQARIQSLKQNHSLLKDRHNKARHLNRWLNEHFNVLQAKHDALRQDRSSLQTDYDSIKTKLSDERSRNAELESKTQSLRSLLIPSKELQLSDGEVVSKFTSMRSQILKLVKTTWRRDGFDTSKRLTDIQVEYFRPFLASELDMKYLDNVLRSLVFASLDKHIFSARTYALDKDFADLDAALGKTEAQIWETMSEDRFASAVDWRIATMKATAHLRKDKYRLSRAAQREVWSCFQILHPRNDKSAEEGKQLLAKICNDAVDLSLMMRSAKDEYIIDFMDDTIGQSISQYDDLVEEEASQPALAQHPAETVATIIAGVLAKRPNGNLNGLLVLEKAQAVVYSEPKKK
ncbi:hypothetical protein N0V82_002737 [Gnomoniopsis sp. IMI 355080]|nr:hypothetical protein N0V82_002737 [Gnomoniopsis sp. IMI 355080]